MASTTTALQKEQRRNLSYNVTIIGWMGNILSAATLISAAMLLQCRHAIIEMILQLLNICSKHRENALRIKMHQFMLVVGVGSYALSIGNIVVCTLLLVGVARKTHACIWPWLLYQALLFGVALHLALYLALSNLFTDYSVFVLAVMVSAMALIIFIKIFYEVFLVFKIFISERKMAEASAPRYQQQSQVEMPNVTIYPHLGQLEMSTEA